MRSRLPLLLLAVALVSSCSNKTPPAPSTTTTSTSLTSSTSSASSAAGLRVTSPAFAEGQPIPKQFTCDGANQSPPVAWSGVPPEARSLTLLVEDHDAKPAFVHWKVTGITPSTTAVAAGGVPPGGTEAANGRGRPGYTGPCPPPTDPAHHYVFRVQALDAAGNVVAEGRLTALYKRGG